MADVHIDWRVLAFTAGLAVVTGLAFGLAPALQASRTALTESLRTGGRGAALSVSQRLRNGLVIAEIAFAVLLVIAAGLLVRSFWALSHVNAGFQPEDVITARITPSQPFCRDEARCLAFYRQVLDRIRTSPGVSGAALVNTLPLDGRVAKRSLNLEGPTAPGVETSPLDIFRSIMGEGAQLSLAGVGLGMAAAAVVTRVLSRELYGVGAADPPTYAAVAVVMVTVTMAACWVPTYRAMRVDPLIALRQE